MPMTGGITDVDEPATPEVHEIIQKVQGEVTGKMNSKADVFEAISFRTQLVAGRNYFVKVHIGDNKCIHVRIYKNLQQELSVHSLQEDKTKEEPISYF